MDTTFIFIIFGVLIIWLLIVTIVVFRMISHYNQLTTGVTKAALRDVLDKLLEAKLANQKQIIALSHALELLEEQERTHVQRVGIVRFNPFSDTGGTQSFSMALLDGLDNGIIMTSLYARTGNRWYIKHIQKGKSDDVELSREEQAAIKKAIPMAHGVATT